MSADYEFDAPQIVDFPKDEAETEAQGAFATTNEDGYFVEREVPREDDGAALADATNQTRRRSERISKRMSRMSVYHPPPTFNREDDSDEEENLLKLRAALAQPSGARSQLALPHPKAEAAPQMDEAVVNESQDDVSKPSDLEGTAEVVVEVSNETEQANDEEAYQDVENRLLEMNIEEIKQETESPSEEVSVIEDTKKDEIAQPNIQAICDLERPPIESPIKGMHIPRSIGDRMSIGAGVSKRMISRASIGMASESGYDPRMRRSSRPSVLEKDVEAGQAGEEETHMATNTLNNIMNQTDALLKPQALPVNEQRCFRGTWAPVIAKPAPVRHFVPIQEIRPPQQEPVQMPTVSKSVQEYQNETYGDAQPPQSMEERHSMIISGEQNQVEQGDAREDIEAQIQESRPDITRPVPRSILSSSIQRVEATSSHLPATSLRRPSEDDSVITDMSYRVKSRGSIGGRNVPGYMTPTESCRIKQRGKVLSPRPQTPPPRPSTPTQLVNPRAPHLATAERKRAVSGQLKSSTTLQLMKLQEERQRLQEKRRQEQEQLMRVQRGVSRAPSPRPMTNPQPFSFDMHTQRHIAIVQHAPSFQSLAELSNNILRRDARPRRPSNAGEEEEHKPKITHPVIPQSPRLRSDSRVRGSTFKTTEEMELERIRLEIEEEKRKKAQHRAMMERSLNGSGISVASVGRRSLTEPQPFALRSIALHERRQEELHRREEERLRREEAMRGFKARPVPSQVTESRRAPSPSITSARELTVPVAPTCVERALVAEQMRMERLEAEERETRRQREFHARPLPRSTHLPTFVPSPAPQVLVEPRAPNLRTEQRAEKWQETEQQRQIREQEEKAARETLERQRLAEEEEALRIEREARQFRARPVPKSCSVRAVDVEQFGGGGLPDFDMKREPMMVPRMPLSAVKNALGGGAARIVVSRPENTTA